ncbi:alpha/beta fold hydrolase [Marinobacter sp. GN3S48]|uniref:alpha/beta fold hydrolase n=1 Tax=Marinobacter sp. GN3S48 TaxID=3382302 RepID=UPI00387B80D6
MSFTTTIRYRQTEADGVNIFYREAGLDGAPVFLLLHGFPSSSHQFRNLIPRLAEHYHVIAPDLPGFGFTEVPDKRNYHYSFDNLANTLDAFVKKLHLNRFSLFVFDYGAPVGLKLAISAPHRVSALVSQNGNAYLDGLGPAWAPVRAYWEQPNTENRQKVQDAILHFEGTRWQYLEGVSDTSLVAPESYTLDAALLERVGNKDIQLDLFLDYQNNLKLYPEFQKYFRQSQLPTLVIWGSHDPFFIPPGAHAFKKDNPNATVELLDTGHFALETHCEYIADRIIEVLGNSITPSERSTPAGSRWQAPGDL